MPYSKALKKIVEQSNFSHKNIIENLEKKGVHIDKSYLSKLINGKLSAPKEEISRAIAQVCGADERILVVEGYYDKAPKEIKDLLVYLKNAVYISSLSLFTNTPIDKNTLSLIKEKAEQESIGEFIVSLLDYNNNDNFEIFNGSLEINSQKDNFKFELKEPISISITNDDMFPIIPKNSSVIIDILEKYTNGSIVALNYENNIIARYYFENNGIVCFTGIDKNSKVLYSSDKNLKLLGKITKVITSLE